MSYCQKGLKLLQDLQRSDWLPMYDEEGIRQVLAEMEDIYGILKGIQEEYRDFEGNYPNSVKVAVAYFLHCQTRNQRYLQSYLIHRSTKIRGLRWETGVVMPDKIQKDKVSSRETEYFTEYNKILSDCFEGIGFDLTFDVQPPKELLVQVRVLKSSGELMTEKGPVMLDAGSTHFLRKSDVEHLVRQGIMEHVKEEET